MLWLVGIIILGILYLFNVIYPLLATKYTRNKKWKCAAITVALILAVHFFYSEILKYINYSYALISESGEIIKSKNFNYKVVLKNNHSPEYIIMDLHNPKNLTLQPYKAVSSEFTEINEGFKIEFIATGYGNPIVTSKFKIELYK